MAYGLLDSAGTLAGQDIVCFANDWDSDPLSKKHIMRVLARKNRILWINSIGTRNPQATVRDLRRSLEKLRRFSDGCRQAEENIWVFSPIAIPFHGMKAAQWMNRQWLTWKIREVCGSLGFRDVITWSFLPTTAGVVGELNERYTIYHCVDEFSEFTGTNKSAVRELERRLMEKVDLVVVSSGPLFEAKKPYNAETHLVTHGVDVNHFRKACAAETPVPEEVASLKRPVIGFHGLIADWVDLELVRFLAKRRPEWSFVLVGKCETSTAILDGLANVHLTGRRDYAQLPGYCKGFDVAMLPFVINELTLAANPLKLREYLAAGLPVVSSNIPEAVRMGQLLRIGHSPEQFLAQLVELIARGERGPRLERSLAMESESWEAKAAVISRLIARRGGSAGDAGAKANARVRASSVELAGSA